MLLEVGFGLEGVGVVGVGPEVAIAEGTAGVGTVGGRGGGRHALRVLPYLCTESAVYVVQVTACIWTKVTTRAGGDGNGVFLLRVDVLWVGAAGSDRPVVAIPAHYGGPFSLLRPLPLSRLSAALLLAVPLGRGRREIHLLGLLLLFLSLFLRFV